MKFIYLDAEGNRIGPVDESVIDRGIRDGSITADTAISNALLQDFCTVAQMDCFAEALKAAPGAAEAAAAAAEAERNLPLWIRLRRASDAAGKRAAARHSGKHTHEQRIQREKHQPQPLIADARIPFFSDADIVARIPVRP